MESFLFAPEHEWIVNCFMWTVAAALLYIPITLVVGVSNIQRWMTSQLLMPSWGFVVVQVTTLPS
jgi:hypothetical protein